MTKKDELAFLHEQLAWIEEQSRLYDEIDRLLMEMKDIAEEATEDRFSHEERESLQKEMDKRKKQVEALYAQMNNGDVH